jgi:hypothetical protein
MFYRWTSKNSKEATSTDVFYCRTSNLKTFVSAHKEYFWLCDLSETFMSSHKGCFCNVGINLPLLILRYKAAMDRGKQYCNCFLKIWKKEQPMSGQKTVVIAHKEYFWLCDRSETFMSAHKDYFYNISIILQLLILGCEAAADREKQYCNCFLKIWTKEQPMSGQKTVVIAHKEYFWL